MGGYSCLVMVCVVIRLVGGLFGLRTCLCLSCHGFFVVIRGGGLSRCVWLVTISHFLCLVVYLWWCVLVCVFLKLLALCRRIWAIFVWSLVTRTSFLWRFAGCSEKVFTAAARDGVELVSFAAMVAFL